MSEEIGCNKHDDILYAYCLVCEIEGLEAKVALLKEALNLILVHGDFVCQYATDVATEALSKLEKTSKNASD